jgi:hypothetical protein
MALLDNSKRRLPQAVYAKVSLRDREGAGAFKPRQPWAKAGLLAAMRPAPQHLAEAKRRAEEAGDRNAVMLLDALAPYAGDGGIDPVEAAAAVAPFEDATVAAVAETLLEGRRTHATRALAAFDAAVDALREDAGDATTAAGPQPPPGARRVTEIDPAIAGGEVFRIDEEEELGGPEAPERPRGRSAVRRVRSRTFVTRAAVPVTRSRRSHLALSLPDAVEVSLARNLDPAPIEALLDLATEAGYEARSLQVGVAKTAIGRQLNQAAAAIDAFKKSANAEPIGFLHLERLTFAPDGIERGELVHSVPLAPGEEVNIAHKEWATRSEEFQKIITDELEDFSEQGVVEKTDLSQATSSQEQHSNGLSTSLSVSGGYGPVNVSSSLSANVANSASETEQLTRTSSSQITRKASSRAKREHKVSFKVASAAGTEDQSVRRIVNPFPDRAARVDYYQLMRKWEVSVYRFGIRLTYDVTIAEPGSDALAKILELNALTAALKEGFGSAGALLDWAKFTLKPGEITRENYVTTAARYGASVPEPPPEYLWYDVSAQHQWKTADDARRQEFFSLEIDVDQRYRVDDVDIDRNFSGYEDEDHDFGMQSGDDFIGRSGPCVLIYRAVFLGSLYVELKVRARLRDEALRTWQLKAWNVMREAAQSRFYEQRLLLSDRLAQLKAELGDEDALSLRKFEHEEVMKGVLRWLFGPDFRFVPPGLPDDLYGANESLKSQSAWQKLTRHGELIRFLHHAVEWENVLYLLYPYFWSHTSRWELKKWLDHPDPRHRAFLKAGAARVVLTIRPGFERDFAALLEQGTFAPLPDDHPYITIIEEMESYAQTHYPGIPPADEPGTDADGEGELVARWHEYTPTSAMDIAFDETMPTA